MFWGPTFHNTTRIYCAYSMLVILCSWTSLHLCLKSWKIYRWPRFWDVKIWPFSIWRIKEVDKFAQWYFYFRLSLKYLNWCWWWWTKYLLNSYFLVATASLRLLLLRHIAHQRLHPVNFSLSNTVQVAHRLFVPMYITEIQFIIQFRI